MGSSAGSIYDEDSKYRAFFHLPGAVRYIILKSRKRSLNVLDFKSVSVRKELLANGNADA